MEVCHELSRRSHGATSGAFKQVMLAHVTFLAISASTNVALLITQYSVRASDAFTPSTRLANGVCTDHTLLQLAREQNLHACTLNMLINKLEHRFPAVNEASGLGMLLQLR